MNSKIHYLVTGVLLLGGCGLAEGQVEEFDPSEPEEAIESAGEVEANNQAEPYTTLPGIDEACMDREAPVIGLLLQMGECDLGLAPNDPLWDNWAQSRLFEDGSDWVQMLGVPVPPSLGAYCKFDYIGRGWPENVDPEPNYTALWNAVDNYGLMSTDQISTDCLGVAPMAGLADEPVVLAFNEVFRASVGAVDAAALAGMTYGDVRVGLLDTSSGAATPVHAHGQQMRNVLEDLMCPGGDVACTDQIHHSLVTPRVGVDTVDWFDGGDVGYATDFSLGAYYEIQSWLEDIDTNGFKRLILAAPVGYDVGATYSTDPNRATTKAMTDVLMMASCYGAITIAPAGNVRSGTCANTQTGALAPSYFEALPGADALTCAAMGFDDLSWDVGQFPVFSPGAPLVYSVGALTERDEEIHIARPNSMPRLASYALAAAGDPNGDPDLGRFTPMTGTSVATISVAAAAGLRWSLDPSLTGHEVMQDIYDHGWTTAGLTADAGGWVGADVHRLSITRVLRVAGLPVSYPAQAPAPATLFDPIEAATNQAILDSGGTQTILPGSAPGAPLCDIPDLDEVLTPQPDRPVCGACSTEIGAGAAGQDLLYMTIVEEPWAIGLLVDHAYLHVYDHNRNKLTITLDDNLADINAADSAVVLEVEYDAPNTESAMLEFEYDDGSNYTNWIPVYEH